MAANPANILRSLLDALSLGDDVTVGSTPAASREWPIYRSKFADKPDNAIAVYDTTGQQDNRIQATGEYDEHAGLMIQIRAIDYATGFDKADAVKTALDQQVYDETVIVGLDTYLVHSITRKGTINYLGQEEGTARVLFSINLLMTIATVIP